MSPRWLVIALVLVPAAPRAQEVSGPPGPRLLLEREHEIRLARSAAPRAISDSATVWVFERGTYVVAARGSSGVECYVSRSWPESIEPHCFDAEGARTIMRLHMRGVELAHAGVIAAEARGQLAAALADGTFRLPQRPAMSWMMSSAQVLYSDSGQRVGAWRPHLMIYIPFLTAEMIGTTASTDPTAGLVVDAGKPTANLMIVVPTAVPLAPAAGSP